MSTTTKNTLATKTLSQGESRYGTPEPQNSLHFPKGTSYRVVKAALHEPAAELADATPAEAARGMAMLERARAVSHEQAPESMERLARPTFLVDRTRDPCELASKFAHPQRSRSLRDARSRDRQLRRDDEEDRTNAT